MGSSNQLKWIVSARSSFLCGAVDMVQVSVNGLDAISITLGQQSQAVKKAAVRAMNRGMAAGRTIMTKSISQDTGLKSGTVRDALVYQQASFSQPEASLAASLKRIPLIEFNAKDSGVNRGTGRRSNAVIRGVRSRTGSGVTYKLPTGAGRIPDAFIATMASGHRGVFVRAGRGRLPIRERFGPSIGHVFSKYRADALARVIEMFQKNFGHELEVETNGIVKAASA